MALVSLSSMFQKDMEVASFFPLPVSIVHKRLVAASFCLALMPCFPVMAGHSCLIEPAQTIELASPITGLLKAVHVKRGDLVLNEQLVAQLDSQAEQASVELSRFKSQQTGPVKLAENKVEYSRRKFERFSKVAEKRFLAIQERDEAESEYKLAESELQVAQENRQVAQLEYRYQSALLALRSIRSPFDGVVVEQVAYPGEVVEPGSNKTIVKLAQLNPLLVHIILPKEMFGKLVTGMEAEVIPDISEKRKYTARIVSIDRLIDAASGTFVVYLKMDNPDLTIPAGVGCMASFKKTEPSQNLEESVTFKD